MNPPEDSTWVPARLREDLKRAALGYVMNGNWFVHNKIVPDENGFEIRSYWSDLNDREQTNHFRECYPITPSVNDVTIEFLEDDEPTGSDHDTRKVSLVRVTPMRCCCGRSANIAVKASMEDVARELIIASLR